jgi:hypothetical protein
MCADFNVKGRLMAVASYSLREDYWDTFEVQEEDIEFLFQHLLEVETPLTPRELMQALVRDRIDREKKSIEKRRSAGGDIFKPKESYETGQVLAFPAFNWRQGKVTGKRPGANPDTSPFEVIEVEFEAGDRREFACGLEDHRLNTPLEFAPEDSLMNPDLVMEVHGDQLSDTLEEHLLGNPETVYIAGRWFPRALLVDVNVGHLNLAEALLDMEAGGPLSTRTLLEQVELPTNINPKLVEFSLDLALQDDARFDEVGPAGQVLWFLNRLEPKAVLEAPLTLRYKQIEYDRSVLDDQMLELEKELEDELSPFVKTDFQKVDQLELRLIYPHWRAGTLPLSPRLSRLFPTAYEAPRIQLMLVDGETGDTFPGWVVRENRYVYGLEEWYKERSLIPGSRIQIRRSEKPGEVIVQTDSRRTSREWVRTVLVGTDGGVVLAMLKQVVPSNYDERMAIAVPDAQALDAVWDRIRKERTPFEKVVVDMFRELAKLNTQQHVHASELYAAVNLKRRCPPGPILALLASRPWFAHVGDFYYRLTDFEGA